MNLRHLNCQQYSNRKRIVRAILSFILLIIGGLIYICCREKSLLMFKWFEKLGINGDVDTLRGLINADGVYGWVKYNLPDGLWLFAYMFLVDIIWNGSNAKVSFVFIFSMPIVALISEILQYYNLLPGVFDWIDIASYVFAILLFIILKLIK